MDIVEEKLESELVEEMDALANTTVGGDGYDSTVNGTCKLMDRYIELKKIHADQELKKQQLEMERLHKKKELRSENIDRIVKHTISFAGTALTLAGYIWVTCFSTRFEETGNYTTTIAKSTLSKFIPKGLKN